MPDEPGWMGKRRAADATSASLRKADLTSRSLQEAESEPAEPGCDEMAKTEIGVIPSDAYRAGNHTVISDRPRFPHAKYGISLTGKRFTAGAHRW